MKGLGGEAGATPESPICDLDYEKNRGFFHYFLKIRGIVKKLAIFYTIFLAAHLGVVLASNAVTRQKSHVSVLWLWAKFIVKIFLGTPKYPLILSGVSPMVAIRDFQTGYLYSS